jgi:hypothetical protein
MFTPDKTSSIDVAMKVKDEKGTYVLDASASMAGALLNPGKPQTIHLPLGGPLSLEIKATVVPNPVPAPTPKANESARSKPPETGRP